MLLPLLRVGAGIYSITIFVNEIDLARPPTPGRLPVGTISDVGRVSDWHMKAAVETSGGGAMTATVREDPGVLLTLELNDHFNSVGLPTEVMGASFRNVEQVVSLAACNHLTIGEIALLPGSKMRRVKALSGKKRAKGPFCRSGHRAKRFSLELDVETLACLSGGV